MKITIELSDGEVGSLRERAQRLGISPEELARLAVADLLDTEESDFLTAAKRVLKKNEELYRRLT